MGEIIPFPRQRSMCSRWQHAHGAITLAARPACAALAMALAPTPEPSREDAGRAPATFLLFR